MTTSDVAAVSDITREQMALGADLSGSNPVAVFGKELERWVSAFVATNSAGDVTGYLFCTLERLGGTPVVLLGLAAATESVPTTVRSLNTALRKKAFACFPDEDVVFAIRAKDSSVGVFIEDFGGFQPTKTQPGGEERAWGRRLAKRFELAGFDDKSMTFSSKNQFPAAIAEVKVGDIDIEVSASKDKATLVWAWAMVEDLMRFA